MNIKLIQTILIVGVLSVSVSTVSIAKTISVRVTNIDTNKPGNIMVMLFAKEGFPKEHNKALSFQNQKAKSTEVRFNFSVEVGQFAIKILHDENEDGKISKNWTGIIPAEGLGFSNGAKLSWRGPPNFKDAALSQAQTHDEIVIPVIYP